MSHWFRFDFGIVQISFGFHLVFWFYLCCLTSTWETCVDLIYDWCFCWVPNLIIVIKCPSLDIFMSLLNARLWWLCNPWHESSRWSMPAARPDKEADVEREGTSHLWSHVWCRRHHVRQRCYLYRARWKPCSEEETGVYVCILFIYIDISSTATEHRFLTPSSDLEKCISAEWRAHLWTNWN